MVHKTQEQFLEEMRASATNQVKTLLVMRELVKTENIEVSDEAIREEMVRYAIENRISEQDLQNQVKERSFINEMANKVILKKIREFLFSKTQIEDEPVVD
jgi:FKBP-type peptidyl-prolyl cis-trans isomerase (trigger factor)